MFIRWLWSTRFYSSSKHRDSLSSCMLQNNILTKCILIQFVSREFLDEVNEKSFTFPQKRSNSHLCHGESLKIILICLLQNILLLSFCYTVERLQ